MPGIRCHSSRGRRVAARIETRRHRTSACNYSYAHTHQRQMMPDPPHNPARVPIGVPGGRLKHSLNTMSLNLSCRLFALLVTGAASVRSSSGCRTDPTSSSPGTGKCWAASSRTAAANTATTAANARAAHSDTSPAAGGTGHSTAGTSIHTVSGQAAAGHTGRTHETMLEDTCCKRTMYQ